MERYNPATKYELKNLGLWERLKQRQFDFLDVDDFKYLKRSLDETGFGYTRVRIKGTKPYTRDGQKLANSTTSMLRVDKNNDGSFTLTRVPGLHVVTAHSTYKTYYNPESNFLGILKHGFHGGKYVNTYLLDQDYFDMLTEFGYPGNPHMGTYTKSEQLETFGDHYKLILWTGFSRNYSSTSQVDSLTLPYGQGTVGFVPANQVEAYIVLDANANIEQRTVYYQNMFEQIPLGSSATILTATYQHIRTLHGSQ